MRVGKFSIGALGGTFDHFHAGHAHFLQFASKKAVKLLIGLTNQSLIREKELSSIIQPYEVRRKAIQTFCEEHDIHAEIVELTDAFGPTLGERSVDCLIVTELTVFGGQRLNQRRSEKSLTPLPVFVCPMLHDQAGKVLNSTRIRQGLVSREGVVYSRLFSTDLVLNDQQREFFKKPIGQLVKQPTMQADIVAVVGDRCLEEFLQNDWIYHIGVYDLQSERKKVDFEKVKSIQPDDMIVNSAGRISKQAFIVLKTTLFSMGKQGGARVRHIQVNGEEDLFAVALLLQLPLGSTLYYGQPGAGMVEVVVTEELKGQLYTHLKEGR